MLSDRDTKHLSDGAETSANRFIYIASSIPQEAITGDPDATHTDKDLVPTQKTTTGIADFITFLNILKNNHKGFEIRLLQGGKKAMILWLDAKYVLRSLATPNKIHAHGIADVYAYLSELNDAGRNVYAVINHTDYEALRSDLNASKVFKWRVAKDKNGNVRRKPDGSVYRESYDPATGKKAMKVSSTKDSHINCFDFLFIDIDDMPTGTQSNYDLLMSAPIQPAMIVQSSKAHKLQAYWRIDGVENANQFRKLQKGLIQKFNGDKAIHNAARIMRVSGFNHVKQINNPMPSMVLHSEDTAPIPVNSFIDVMGLDLSTPQKPSKPRKKSSKVITPSESAESTTHELVNKDLPFDVEVLLANAQDLDDFKHKFNSVYPAHASFRHWLCLWGAGEMLLRFNVSEYDTLEFITDVVIANGDEELSDRLTAVSTTYARHANGESIKGVRKQRSYREWKQCFYSSLLKIPKTERTDTAYRRVLTTLYHNQLSDGVLGAFALSKIATYSGVGKEKTRKIMNQLKEEGIVFKIGIDIDRSYIYRIVLPKNIDTLLLEIETEASTEDIARLEHKVSGYNKATVKHRATEGAALESSPESVEPVAVEQVDTVVIPVEVAAPQKQMLIPVPTEKESIKPTEDYNRLE